MGANYNSFLVPNANRDVLIRAIDFVLESLGCKALGTDHADEHGVFRERAESAIFLGPSESPWVLMSTWGDGLHCEFPSWYTENPFGIRLSREVEPIIYLFSYNSGFVAGYSIFSDGSQIESKALGYNPKMELAAVGEPPARLRNLLGDTSFCYESFCRGFPNLEVAAGNLASRLGASVHLLEPFDIADGDGGIAVDGTEYHDVQLLDWTAIFYRPAHRC